MTTKQMIDRIRANNQTLGHKFLQAVADRLESQAKELDAKSEQIRSLGRDLLLVEAQRRDLAQLYQRVLMADEASVERAS